MNKLNQPQPLISLLSSIYNLMPVKLDDNNYITWSFQMQNMLKSLGLEGYIDGSFPCPPQFLLTNSCIEAGVTREFQEWERNDKALMTLISATLSSEALSFVVGSQNSCEVWKNIRVRYGVHSRTAAMQLQSKLYKIQKGNDTIDKYFQRIKDITDKLASVDIHIPDEEIVIIAVSGLPSEYMTIKIVVKALITTISMHKLRSLLLDEESYMDQSTESMQNNLHTVNNSSVISGTYDHYNTPITSTVHHFNGPSPISTTHLGTPRNDMISSAVTNVRNATSSCQAMFSPSAKFGASQTMCNGSYFSAPTLSYGYAPQTDGFMHQNGTFIAQNGGSIPASQQNYSQKGFSHNDESQQQGSHSHQQSSSSVALSSNSKNGPGAMVAHNSINDLEVKSFHSSLSHLGSVALIDEQKSPISEIRDESGKDLVHNVHSQIVNVPSKDYNLFAKEASEHKDSMVLSGDGYEPSKSTVLESALQSKKNDALRNGLSANESRRGSKLEILSRAELSPNIVDNGGSRKQKSESELLRVAKNVYNRMVSSSEQSQAQSQLTYGQETMELFSKNLMNCRQYCQPMQLWPSLPLIPPD